MRWSSNLYLIIGGVIVFDIVNVEDIDDDSEEISYNRIDESPAPVAKNGKLG